MLLACLVIAAYPICVIGGRKSGELLLSEEWVNLTCVLQDCIGHARITCLMVSLRCKLGCTVLCLCFDGIRSLNFGQVCVKIIYDLQAPAWLFASVCRKEALSDYKWSP